MLRRNTEHPHISLRFSMKNRSLCGDVFITICLTSLIFIKSLCYICLIMPAASKARQLRELSIFKTIQRSIADRTNSYVTVPESM